ncbi:MAG TPA: transposase, partial [Pseudonocardiaceae bacterium]|nr:transposase [Pseudonocardiaceae bacterium]
GERKARLVLEVLRDREADVLRFAHDLNVPATSNQAERDLRPSKTQQRSPDGSPASNAPKTATASAATYRPPPNMAAT